MIDDRLIQADLGPASEEGDRIRRLGLLSFRCALIAGRMCDAAYARDIEGCAISSIEARDCILQEFPLTPSALELVRDLELNAARYRALMRSRAS
jgi:hypothetical protein